VHSEPGENHAASIEVFKRALKIVNKNFDATSDFSLWMYHKVGLKLQELGDRNLPLSYFRKA